MIKITDIFLGNRSKLTAENRIINFISVVTSLIGFLYIPILIILRFHLLNILLLILTTILFILFYIVSRFKHQYKQIVVPLILTITLYLTTGCFIAAGLHGTHHYFFILNALLIVILIRGKSKIILICLNIIIIFGLLFINYLFPDIIRPYSSKSIQDIVVPVGFLLSFLSCVFVVGQVINNLDTERNKLKQKNEQYSEEMELAKHVQNNLITKTPPLLNGINLYYIYEPKGQIGGDFFEFIRFSEPHKIGIFISDASGHGIPAALITSMIKTLIITSGKIRLSPTGLLEYINKNIIGLISNNFITAFYGIYNTEDRNFCYARCGHPYPYFIRDNEIIELKSKGMAMGIMDTIHIEEVNLIMRPGDKILFYTDCLTETVNKFHENFEEKSLIPVINKSIELKIENFIHYIYDELIVFQGDSSFDDDICLIGLEITE